MRISAAAAAVSFRRLRLACFSALCVVTWPGLAAATALDHVTLQLKWKHQFQFAGYYEAVERGFYRDAGLDVTLREADEDSPPSDRVLHGQAEFGIDTSELIVLRAHGDPVVALAAIYQHSPLVLVTLKQSGIEHIHDLSGHKVMFEPDAAELLAYMKLEGIPKTSLQLLNHDFDPAMLIGGQVDAMSAYATDEPFVLREKGVEYLTFSPRAAGIDFYGDTLFTTEKQVADHPARVRAFVDASLKGWQYALAHPEEAVQLILAKYSTRHSAAHLKFEAEQTQHLIIPDIVALGYMNPGRWQHIGDTYADLGLIPRNFSLDGFLYDEKPKPAPPWLYAALAGSLAVLSLVTFIALRFYRLHAALKTEMHHRVRMGQQLLEAERRYRFLAENAPFPIVIARVRDGSLRYLNSKAEQALGFTLMNAPEATAATVLPDENERRALLSDPGTEGVLRQREARVVTASGGEFWVSATCARVEFESEPSYLLSFVDVTDRREREARLHELAMTDELTGLDNRRQFLRRGQEEFLRFHRERRPFAVIMLDLDHFKAINDAHGHAAGDAVLRRLAAVLKRTVRESDVVGRLGGEEFGALLPRANLSDALALAERIRTAIETDIASDIRFTASLGVAEVASGSAAFDDVLKLADDALYAAKQQGRNRVVGASAETLSAAG